MKKRLAHLAVLGALVVGTLAWPTAVEALPSGVCTVNASVVGGANNGSSWADAYASLQDALTESSCLEIWVAAGVYKPGSLASDAFTIRAGAAVYGGFDAGESTREERDWTTNATILSGDLAGDDVDPDGDHIIQDAIDIVTPNTQTVVKMQGVSVDLTGSTILDGFTITAGDNTNNTSGGLECRGTWSGSVCSPTLNNLTFSGNRSNDSGGALHNNAYSSGVSSPSLTNVVFTGNRAGAGGAMYNNGGTSGTSSPTLTNVTFVNNWSNNWGGAMSNNGGAGHSNPVLTNVTFEANHATIGGAMFNSGWSGESSPVLTDVTFSHNVATGSGAAMYNSGAQGVSSPVLNRVTFNENSAGGSGGAMFNSANGGGQSNPTVANATFTLNTAGLYGGAIHDMGDGGTSNPTFTNVTFSGNVATGSGGAIDNEVSGAGTANPTLTNVILWGDSATSYSEIRNVGGTPAISYSVVQGGCASISGATCGSGNLSTDPALTVLEDNGGFTQTMAIAPASSAIDAGTNVSCPTRDQRGGIRPVDGNGDGTFTCDIGAVEYLPSHVFADLPTIEKEWMESFINAFYFRGITTGCGIGPLIYCPENNVTRAEMAVFILRAMHGLGYAPPAPTGVFGDVPVAGKEWMQAWIEDFYAHGITTGCGAAPLIYCPERQVTRAEMAVFLTRAIHPVGFTPPPASGIFDDLPVVGKEWMEARIEHFYSHGITTGCGVSPLRYCPENNTTRAEMAVFIDRAYGLYP